MFAVACLFTVEFWTPARADTTDWLTDLPKALAQAKSEHKSVFMDFTGSDWCPACIEVHKKVLTTQLFEDYAKTNLVCVIVDFPNSKPQTDELKAANKALADKFHVEGFPTLILLNGDGKELNRELGYEGETPKDFIANLEKAKQKG